MTLLIEFLGGPGSGKTTTLAQLWGYLKGLKNLTEGTVEFVREYYEHFNPVYVRVERSASSNFKALGRVHSLSESIDLDNKIRNLMPVDVVVESGVEPYVLWDKIKNIVKGREELKNDLR